MVHEFSLSPFSYLLPFRFFFPFYFILIYRLADALASLCMQWC